MLTIKQDLVDIHDTLAQAIEYIQLGVSGKKYDPSWIRPMCLSNEERKQDYIAGIRALSGILQWCADNMEGANLHPPTTQGQNAQGFALPDMAKYDRV